MSRGREPLAGVVAVAVAGLVLGACGGGDGDLEAFCATARRFAVDNPAAVFDRYDPADPTGAAALLREAGVELAAWADEAPGEIDGAVDTIAEAAVRLAGSFEDPDGSDADDLRASFEAIEAASRQVVTFTSESCGVDLEPASTVSVVVDTTTTLAAEG